MCTFVPFCVQLCPVMSVIFGLYFVHISRIKCQCFFSVWKLQLKINEWKCFASSFCIILNTYVPYLIFKNGCNGRTESETYYLQDLITFVTFLIRSFFYQCLEQQASIEESWSRHPRMYICRWSTNVVPTYVDGFMGDWKIIFSKVHWRGWSWTKINLVLDSLWPKYEPKTSANNFIKYHITCKTSSTYT
jgi:hypothetical protein